MDEVAGDEDDAVRTSDGNRVMATLCTEEFFLSTQYIQLTPYIRKVKHGEGYRWLTRRSQLGFHTSRLNLNTIKTKTQSWCKGVTLSIKDKGTVIVSIL
jgi:hypothetical protein